MLDFDTAIFDLDGTLLDSLSVWDKIDSEFLFNKRGIPVPEDYVHKIAPMSFEETAVYTKKRFNLKETPEELMREWTDMAIYEYSHNIFLKEGAREYLKRLKSEGKKMAVATSSPEIFFKPALVNNGIYNLFDAIANTCEAGVGKTKPDVYLLAAEKCGALSHRCLVFEDVPDAALCAKEAGMMVCGVYDERSAVHKKEMQAICDVYINSFTELNLRLEKTAQTAIGMSDV